MERRDFLLASVAPAVVAVTAGVDRGVATRAPVNPAPAPRAPAAYRHSVCRWPFGQLSVDQLAREARRLEMHSVELLEPDEWPIVQAHGLTCAMGYAPAGEPRTRLTKGWNRTEHHAWLVPGYLEGLRLAAAAGVPNIICFSGNRDGLSDTQGLANCAAGLRQIMGEAERLGVTVCMELLNSKVDHADYQCDRTPWGAELVQRVGSARFKLLYDVYHMQIMEGDVIRTLRDHRDAIAHLHVAGVPGRHEIDATQELYYPAIMRALAETGFTGYVAQEFIPTKDPLVALAEAVRICRV